MSLQTRLAALITAIGADIKALQNRNVRGVRVRFDGTYNLNSDAVVAVAWNVEERDDGGLWSPTTPTRLIAPEAGWYAIDGQVSWPSGNNTGSRGVWIAKNGDSNARLGEDVEPRAASIDQRRHRATALHYLLAGEYVELYVWHSAGAQLSLVTGQPFHFGMVPVSAFGPKGDKGDTGNQFFDTTPIGSVIAWSRKTYPSDFVLADGQRLSKALFPDAYAIAQAEVAAGNPMWTVRASDETFTVPNLTDKFLLAPGAKALGVTGGEENHTLTTGEIPAHVHGMQITNAGAFAAGSGRGVGFGSGTGTNTDPTWPGSNTGGAGGGGAHNNMPPYIVLAQIVKVQGVTVSSGVLQGPQGPAGNPALLTASLDSTITDSERVAWIRQSDGSVVAQIYARTVDGPNKTAEVTYLSTGAGTGHANQSFAAQAGGGEARLTVQNLPSLANRKRLVRASLTDDAGAGSIDKDFLRSDGSSDFVLAQKPGDTEQIGEVWRVVGTAGQPGFSAGWAAVRNVSNGNWEYVAFYKDPLGIVHLKGAARATSAQAADSVIFQLPVGYRPNRQMMFPSTGTCKEVYFDGALAPVGSGAPGGLRIATAMGANTNIQIDGISFRAGDGTQA